MTTSSYMHASPAHPTPETHPPHCAPWHRRVASALIDVLVVSWPAILCACWLGATHKDGSGLALAVETVSAVLSFGLWLWQMHRQGTGGQTAGKKVLGTRLVRDSDGRSIGFGWSVLRSILHIVDQLPLLLGYLWPLWDTKRQTFADKLVGSVVVKA